MFLVCEDSMLVTNSHTAESAEPDLVIMLHFVIPFNVRKSTDQVELVIRRRFVRSHAQKHLLTRINSLRKLLDESEERFSRVVGNR